MFIEQTKYSNISMPPNLTHEYIEYREEGAHTTSTLTNLNPSRKKWEEINLPVCNRKINKSIKNICTNIYKAISLDPLGFASCFN
jgi:hypothetical protein